MLLSLCFHDTQIVFLALQKWHNANYTSVYHIPPPKNIVVSPENHSKLTAVVIFQYFK